MDGVDSVVFSSGQDDLGIYIRFSVDTDVHTKAAIFKTAYWFTDQYYLFISRIDDTNLFQVEARPKDTETSLQTLKAACGEFHNYLIDQEVRQQVIRETAVVRDTLVKKAFFEARSPLPANTVSSESHLPAGTQSYREDAVRIGGR